MELLSHSESGFISFRKLGRQSTKNFREQKSVRHGPSSRSASPSLFSGKICLFTNIRRVEFTNDVYSCQVPGNAHKLEFLSSRNTHKRKSVTMTHNTGSDLAPIKRQTLSPPVQAA